jgi:hypothetical protein
MLAGVRMARCLEALADSVGRLSVMAAAELIGVSDRQFRRLRDRYEAEGAEGLIDRRRGRISGRRVAGDSKPGSLPHFPVMPGLALPCTGHPRAGWSAAIVDGRD